MIEDLAEYNPLIISDFARGIDIVAHKASLDNGLETVACLGHGLNQKYPTEHKVHVESVCNQGGILTEFWSNSSFEKSNFLKRNRIIAGVAHATLVIESKAKGGSLVTAEHVHHYERDVFAVQGRVSDMQSADCLNFNRSDKACMITSAADVAFWMGWESNPKPKAVQKELFISMTEDEELLFNLLETKMSLDALAQEAKIPISKVAAILFQLETKGCVRPLAGKQFERA